MTSHSEQNFRLGANAVLISSLKHALFQSNLECDELRRHLLASLGADDFAAQSPTYKHELHTLQAQLIQLQGETREREAQAQAAAAAAAKYQHDLKVATEHHAEREAQLCAQLEALSSALDTAMAEEARTRRCASRQAAESASTAQTNQELLQEVDRLTALLCAADQVTVTLQEQLQLSAEQLQAEYRAQQDKDAELADLQRDLRCRKAEASAIAAQHASAVTSQEVAARELRKALQDAAGSKEALHLLQAQLEVMRDDLGDTAHALQVVTGRCTELTKQFDAERAAKADALDECQQLRASVAELTEELQASRHGNTQLRAALSDNSRETAGQRTYDTIHDTADDIGATVQSSVQMDYPALTLATLQASINARDAQVASLLLQLHNARTSHTPEGCVHCAAALPMTSAKAAPASSSAANDAATAGNLSERQWGEFDVHSQLQASALEIQQLRQALVASEDERHHAAGEACVKLESAMLEVQQLRRATATGGASRRHTVGASAADELEAAQAEAMEDDRVQRSLAAVGTDDGWPSPAGVQLAAALLEVQQCKHAAATAADVHQRAAVLAAAELKTARAEISQLQAASAAAAERLRQSSTRTASELAAAVMKAEQMKLALEAAKAHHALAAEKSEANLQAALLRSSQLDMALADAHTSYQLAIAEAALKHEATAREAQNLRGALEAAEENLDLRAGAGDAERARALRQVQQLQEQLEASHNARQRSLEEARQQHKETLAALRREADTKDAELQALREVLYTTRHALQQLQSAHETQHRAHAQQVAAFKQEVADLRAALSNEASSHTTALATAEQRAQASATAAAEQQFHEQLAAKNALQQQLLRARESARAEAQEAAHRLEAERARHRQERVQLHVTEQQLRSDLQAQREEAAQNAARLADAMQRLQAAEASTTAALAEVAAAHAHAASTEAAVLSKDEALETATSQVAQVLLERDRIKSALEAALAEHSERLMAAELHCRRAAISGSAALAAKNVELASLSNRLDAACTERDALQAQLRSTTRLHKLWHRSSASSDTSQLALRSSLDKGVEAAAQIASAAATEGSASPAVLSVPRSPQSLRRWSRKRQQVTEVHAGSGGAEQTTRWSMPLAVQQVQPCKDMGSPRHRRVSQRRSQIGDSGAASPNDTLEEEDLLSFGVPQLWGVNKAHVQDLQGQQELHALQRSLKETLRALGTAEQRAQLAEDEARALKGIAAASSDCNRPSMRLSTISAELAPDGLSDSEWDDDDAVDAAQEVVLHQDAATGG